MSTRSTRPGNWNICVFAIANALMVLSLWYSASNSAPLFDEPAHFASGVVLAYHSDAGNFRVNPPTNKWITAIAMLFTSEMKLPPIIASSQYGNSMRPEFGIGDAVIELNRDSYMSFLIWARHARIPMMLLGSVMLFLVSTTLLPSRQLLCQILWCTSPLLLGHGWIVSADAPAAIAMCFILVTTIHLWKSQTASRFLLSGIAWGIAIGTKFTFGPLYLMFIPIFYFCSPRRAKNTGATETKVTWWITFVGRWALHGAIACITLNALYCFDRVGVPIGKHDFISRSFSRLTMDRKNQGDSSTLRTWIARVPSPFPKVFLEGVDQQMADMDYPRGAYWMGERIPGEIHWFHLAGYFVKEQIAVWIGIATAVLTMFATLFRRRKVSQPLRDSSIDFCLLYLIGFAGFMTTQCNLVWNIRYLTPALPLIYFLVAGTIPILAIPVSKKTNFYLQDSLAYGLSLIATIEFSIVFPFAFSYANPIVGGSHRVPMVLNDSNFDYGQDLFTIRSWMERQRQGDVSKQELRVYGLLSGHGRFWLTDLVQPATPEIVQRAIQSRRKATVGSNLQSVQSQETTSNAASRREILIVSRGLFAAEPWAVKYSTLSDGTNQASNQTSLRELQSVPPDVFITPVIVGYWIDQAD
jgi:hypothetical protein